MNYRKNRNQKNEAKEKEEKIDKMLSSYRFAAFELIRKLLEAISSTVDTCKTEKKTKLILNSINESLKIKTNNKEKDLK